MKYTLDLSPAETVTRLEAVCLGYYDTKPFSKSVVTQKINGTVQAFPNLTSFVLKIDDDRFLFSRIPRIFLKGDVKTEEGQTILQMNYSFSIWAYIMYFLLGLISIAIFSMYDVQTSVSFLLCLLFPIIITMIYNLGQKEKLIQVIRFIFRDDNLQKI